MYTYLATGILAALLAGFGTWQVQDWRYAAKETERVTNQAEIDRLADRSRLQQQERVTAAQNSAVARARIAGAADDLAGGAVDRLLVESRTSLDAARVSHQACLVNAAALEAVSTSCAREYRAMGKAAQGHADDAKTLSDAWPTE